MTKLQLNKVLEPWSCNKCNINSHIGFVINKNFYCQSCSFNMKYQEEIVEEIDDCIKDNQKTLVTPIETIEQS